MSRFTSRKYTHVIFCTSTNVTIQPTHLSRLFDYMREILKEEEVITVGLNGMPDHIHVLCIFPQNFSMPKFVQRMKNQTTLWLKDIDPSYRDFQWKKGYAGFAIRPPAMVTVQHVVNQVYIHNKMSFPEELRMFFRDYRDISAGKCKLWWDD